MTDTAEIEIRREWMGVLARSSVHVLEERWRLLDRRPAYCFIRKPETGMVMVRGRMGGTGSTFNMGEMTLTRCTVKTDEGYAGTAYVQGRNHRHAELAAVLDALLQDRARRPMLMEQVIAPARTVLAATQSMENEQAAKTKVDFFTMVRSE
ncbi:MAG: phosphonate C-P lyase system protein PhnG [Thermodesulfobacteriota bacterium]|nr:phosphonate C-P lyase system protein PhnG [Thermodesulfobacteriota bacterium]